MYPTDKVLGSITAMHTLIDNFPMSILDNMRGRQYPSIFDFLVEILNACGVNVNEIIDFLIEKVYGIEASTMEGLEGLYDQLKNKFSDGDEQNEFLEGLETSIKTILMGLLSSIFSCSALPILPYRVFDGANMKSFSGSPIAPILSVSADTSANAFFQTIKIHKNLLDPMGLLDICPSTLEGRLYYGINGRDEYYKKSYEPVPILIEKNVITSGDTVTLEEVPLFKRQVALFFELEQEGDEYSDNMYKIAIEVSDNNDNFIGGGIDKDIIVSIMYSSYNNSAIQTWTGEIKAGETECEERFFATPIDALGQKTVIKGMTINGKYESGVDVGGGNWVYLDCADFISEWSDCGGNNITCGKENYETEIIEKTITNPPKEITIQEETTIYQDMYVKCNINDIPSNAEVVRVDYLNDGVVTSDEPDYIVYYNGLSPNMLYKSNDMNAFLWYVLNKGMRVPQIEYNHMMWDSRVSAAKIGANFQSNEEWNDWYNSKKSYTDEFKYLGSPVIDGTPIYPIMQLEPCDVNKSGVKIKIPSQRYLLPKLRNYNLGLTELDEDGKTKKVPNTATTLNASLYKYNWEYLSNIKILKPKQLLVGFCEGLLGYALYAASTTNLSLTRKLIEAKLSKAIKTVIEANDMEVEDCYMAFSNDDVNMMLEEMLLSRYSATPYEGNNQNVRWHNTEEYIASLDQINANTTQEGNITAIKKFVTDVTVTRGSEAKIEYGLQLNTDANLLKKLLWAIAMPILMSIFSPQVILLLYINFELTGITNTNDALNGQDFTMILNLLINKIFGLLKSIILFIKDKIVELLLILFYEKIIVTITKFEYLLLLEKIRDWMAILEAALRCLPIYRINFKRNKIIGAIEEVNYADIVNPQNLPESLTTC